MNILAIRKKLSDYLQIADDKKIKEMYALLEDDIKLNENVSLEDYNQDLQEAEEEYKKGDFITHAAMLENIKKW